MRTSILSRSVIAVASLAIGSVALAAAPANAAAPAGVTRDLVLSIAESFHAQDHGQSFIQGLEAQTDQLISQVCNFDLSGGNDVDWYEAKQFLAGSAEGVLISARLHQETEFDTIHSSCTFGALATKDGAFTLSGNVAVSLTTTVEDEAQVPLTAAGTALSGGVFVTEPIITAEDVTLETATLTAAGNATRSINVTTPHKVTTPKSKSAKKAAKKKYNKSLKAAKSKFNKADKNAKAKKAYKKRKAAAKAAYNKAIVTVKTVNKTTTQTENRPFNVNVNVNLDDD